MRGKRRSYCLILALTGVAILTTVQSEARRGRQPDVEIFRYDVAPRLALSERGEQKLAAMAPYGELGVGAYLVVFKLEPGERFVSARAEVKDGLFCTPRRGLGRHMAKKVAAQLFSQVVLKNAASEIGEGLALVAGFLPLDRSSKVPPPQLTSRVRIKRDDVEHHDGYVAMLLIVASNSVTRLSVDRIVTKRVSGPKQRRRKESTVIPFPDPTEAAMPRDRIMSILAGEGRRFNQDFR